MRPRTRGWFPLAGLLLVLTLDPLASAQARDRDDARPVKTNLWLPVSQTVYDPVTAEFVDLAGALHLVTHVYPPDPIFPPDPIRLALHLNGLFEGTGQVTPARYLAVVVPVEFPPSPITPGEQTVVSFILNLFPPNPIVPPNPCLCTGTLGFMLNGDGTVNMDSLVVQLGGRT